MLFKIAVVCFILELALGSNNLIANPSFEADAVSAPGQTVTSVTSWTSSGLLYALKQTTSATVAEGTQALTLNDGSAFVQQSVSTTTGVEYSLTVESRALSSGATLRVSVDSADNDFSPNTGDSFTTFEVRFTATMTTTTIRFSSPSGSQQPIIDNVICVVYKHRYLPASFQREYQQTVPIPDGTDRHSVRNDGYNYGQSSGIGQFTAFISNNAVTCLGSVEAWGSAPCAFVGPTSVYPDASVGTAIKYQFRQNWQYGWYNGTIAVPNGNGVIVRIEYYSTVSSSSFTFIDNLQVGGTAPHVYNFNFFMDDIRNDDIVTIVVNAGPDNTGDLTSVDATFTVPCDDLCTCFFCTPTYSTFCGAPVETPIPTPNQAMEDCCYGIADMCAAVDCTPADDACASDGGIFCTLSAQCLDLTTACWAIVEDCLTQADG